MQLDIELVGSCAELLLDDRDAGVRASVGRVLVGVPSAVSRAAASARVPLGALLGSARGAPSLEAPPLIIPSVRWHASDRSVASEPVAVRVEHVHLETLGEVETREEYRDRTTERSAASSASRSGRGADSAVGAHHGVSSAQTSMLNEAALELSLQRKETSKGQMLTARGNELALNCTEAQLLLLRSLAQQSGAPTPHAPERAATSKPPLAASTPPLAAVARASRPPLTSSEPGLRFHLEYRRAALTLRTARDSVLAYELHNLELEVGRQAVDAAGRESAPRLRAAVGAWELREAHKGGGECSGERGGERGGAADASGSGRGTAVAAAASPRRALLGVPEPEAAPSAPARPLLQFESQGSAHGGAHVRMLYRPYKGWCACAARLPLAVSSGWCSLCARLCRLWMPLARLLAVLCCCLPAFRTLVYMALRELIARACSACCGIAAWRQRARRRAKTSAAELDVLHELHESLELAERERPTTALIAQVSNLAGSVGSSCSTNGGPPTHLPHSAVWLSINNDRL